jgi:hypothetical protein
VKHNETLATQFSSLGPVTRLAVRRRLAAFAEARVNEKELIAM